MKTEKLILILGKNGKYEDFECSGFAEARRITRQKLEKGWELIGFTRITEEDLTVPLFSSLQPECHKNCDDPNCPYTH